MARGAARTNTGSKVHAVGRAPAPWTAPDLVPTDWTACGRWVQARVEVGWAAYVDSRLACGLCKRITKNDTR